MGKSNELRAKLDERGIKWWTDKYYRDTNTCWRVGDFEWHASEREDGKLLIGCTCVKYLTPEQAIAATVGAGTCHAVLDEGYYKGINGVCEGLYCSKCKEPLSRRFNHCPWCGRKIKGD